MKKNLQQKHTQKCLLGKHCVLEKKVRTLEATIVEQQDKKANVVLQLGDTLAELRLMQAESAEQKETIATLQNKIAMQQAVITAQDAAMQSNVAISQFSATCIAVRETNAMLLSMLKQK